MAARTRLKLGRLSGGRFNPPMPLELQATVSFGPLRATDIFRACWDDQSVNGGCAAPPRSGWKPRRRPASRHREIRRLAPPLRRQRDRSGPLPLFTYPHSPFRLGRIIAGMYRVHIPAGPAHEISMTNSTMPDRGPPGPHLHRRYDDMSGPGGPRSRMTLDRNMPWRNFALRRWISGTPTLNEVAAVPGTRARTGHPAGAASPECRRAGCPASRRSAGPARNWRRRSRPEV
jgi:hypothetical protein